MSGGEREGLLIVLFSLVTPFEDSLNCFVVDCSFWPSLLLKLENHIAENVICRAVTKILSCQGDVVSRQGNEQLGRSFGSILLLLLAVSY